MRSYFKFYKDNNIDSIDSLYNLQLFVQNENGPNERMDGKERKGGKERMQVCGRGQRVEGRG